MSKICPCCGTENGDTVSFCVNCGTPLADAQNNVATPVVESTPYQSSYDAVYGQSQAPAYNANVYQGQNYYQQPQGSKGLSIAGMVCGILSIVCCCIPVVKIILPIAAMIMSIISLAKKMPGKGMAIAGLICGIIGFLINVVPSVLLLFGFSSIMGGSGMSTDLIEEILYEFF